jgi:restriction system protein
MDTLASIFHQPLTFYGSILAGLVLYYFAKRGIKALFRRRKPGQRRRERQARRCLATLATISHPARQFAYLRKIDPFVFEEMVLEAYKRAGHKIKRNARYTGDGGIDGRVWIDGHLHLIQAKRYSQHINLGHVKAFRDLVAREKAKGIFVHTGRTGKASRAAAHGSSNLTMVSGQALLDLLLAPDATRLPGERLAASSIHRRTTRRPDSCRPPTSSTPTITAGRG